VWRRYWTDGRTFFSADNRIIQNYISRCTLMEFIRSSYRISPQKNCCRRTHAWIKIMRSNTLIGVIIHANHNYQTVYFGNNTNRIYSRQSWCRDGLETWLNRNSNFILLRFYVPYSTQNKSFRRRILLSVTEPLFLPLYVNTTTLKTVITHRRRIAKRDGCFQRSMFVCQLVCSHDNSERLNAGWWNLAVRHNVQKSGPSSNVKVKSRRSRLPGTKTR